MNYNFLRKKHERIITVYTENSRGSTQSDIVLLMNFFPFIILAKCTYGMDKPTNSHNDDNII